MAETEMVAELLEARVPRGYGGRFYGPYPAVVRDIRDPDGQGRVKIALPWSPDGGGGEFEAWARVATLMAGDNRGSWFIPDSGVEVLVVFLGGDPRQPCVIGSLWNGVDAPPHSMDGAGRNSIKKLRSRNGIVITLDDSDGRETLTLETPGGQKATFADAPPSILLEDSGGNSVKLETAGVTITTSAKVTINASAAEVNAGTLTVNAGMSTFSGTVMAQVVNTPSVIAASYTPGAGNIW